jgi:N utilization substance protein B
VASRRLAREHALQVLFQIDMTGDEPDTSFELHWRERPVDEGTRAFAERLARGALGDAVRIDALIRSAAENWRLERMATVDRNVLRIALYELLHEPETPPAVVLDEAIEIARRFGGEESSQFVNGVLDAIRKKLETAAPRVGEKAPTPPPRSIRRPR